MSNIADRNKVVIAVAVLVLLSIGLYRFRMGANEFDGKMGISMTITYANGDTRTIEPDSPISFLGLRLTDMSWAEREILKIDARLKYKADWVGELQSFKLTGFMETTLDGERIDYDEIEETSIIRKGAYKDIASREFTAEYLELLAEIPGEHHLGVSGELQLKITFKDGESDTKEADHEIVYTFKYVVDAPTGPLSYISEFKIQTYAYPDFA